MSERCRAAFFGGPWADEVKMLSEPAPHRLTVPILVQLNVADCWPNPDVTPEMPRCATYRRGGISDDGTRRYYVET